jgi:DNA excision repair protein ERCC-4
MASQFSIVCDSREQTPFDFKGYPVVYKSLSTGDYSIDGLENLICVERKSLQDFVGCCGSGRDRFKRELQRMKAYRYRHIIIEATYNKMLNGTWRSKLKPSHVTGSMVSWSNRYQIPIWLASDHEKATDLCFNLLRTAHQQLQEFVKAIKI